MITGFRFGVVLVAVALASAACGGDRSAESPSTAEPPTVDPPSPETPELPLVPEESAPSDLASPEPIPALTAAAAVIERSGISWEDLESLAFEVGGETVQLSGGTATVSYGGASSDVYTLQNRVAEGDLDGDGDDDAVAHIVERSAGTGVFHLIVPVIDEDGVPAVRRPVSVGDRIVMDSILIRSGRVEVTLFDRADDEPFTVITRRETLEIDLSGPEPSVRVLESELIEDLPLPDRELADIDIRFGPGAVSVAVSGSVEFRQRQTYTVQATAGQPFTATLEAPLGVWLDVRLGDQVIAAAAERSPRVAATLPSSGPWRVAVVSAHAGRSDYQLTVEVLPLGSEPSPASSGEGVSEPTATAPDEPARPATAATTALVPAQSAGGSGSVIYLTFDDGPHPTYTPPVLDILADHGARATFFVLGALAEAHPELIDRIVAEGHTVASHTWNHEDLAGMPRSSFDETVGRTQAVLGDRGEPCLRPPYGSIDAFTREWAASAGLALVLWTVDTNDWRRPGAATIADRIVAGATDEAIVLMHDGGGNRTQTVRALASAMDRLEGRGLRFEPVCVRDHRTLTSAR